MAVEIINLDAWLTQSPTGQYVLDWEQQQYDQIVEDIFGFHALQIGTPCIEGLRRNRISHRWVMQLQAPAATANCSANFCAAPEALPFQADQLDLVLLPHALEASNQPHQTLREASRVLRPEGKLIISGFNPARFWGVRPSAKELQWGESIGWLRLRDWLHLLDHEIDEQLSGCYIPASGSTRWFQRLEWLDRLAARRVNFLGGIYFIVATKRVPGTRILGPNWRICRPGLTQAAITQRTSK